MSDNKKPEHGKKSDADPALDAGVKVTDDDTAAKKKHDPWLKVDPEPKKHDPWLKVDETKPE